MRILVKSSLIFHDLVQVLVQRSCGDPCEILAKKSLYDLAQILMRRPFGSCGEVLCTRSLHDLVQVLLAEILLKSCLRGPCIILYGLL